MQSKEKRRKGRLNVRLKSLYKIDKTTGRCVPKTHSRIRTLPSTLKKLLRKQLLRKQ